MGLLKNKTAIVTGAASGIGRATALRFAAEGATVVVADINLTGAEETVATIRQTGGDGLALKTDIADITQVKQMVTSTVEHFGGLHVLCNNAADLSLLQYDGDLLQTDMAIWDKTYAANLRSVAAACKYAIPHMLKAGGGAIVNVSSVDAVLGDNTRFAYAAAKAGINVLTLSIATTYGKQGIRCNAVLPGVILSPVALEGFAQAPQLEDAFKANVLTPHLGTPEELASVILFLTSDMASYVNGQLINVDGGLLSHVPHYVQVQEYFANLPSTSTS